MSQRTEPNIATAKAPVLLDAARVTAVPVDMLMPDPQQPRTDFDAAAIKALATNIAAYGIESPLIVRGDYVIKHGERRWRAAKLAGLTHVPCLLAGDADPEHPGREWLLDQYAHNTLQRGHTAIETAAMLKRLVSQHGFKVGELPKLLAARGIDISRPQASNLMRLLELPDWAQSHINTGRLSPAHGRALLTAKSPKVLEKMRTEIEGWDDNVVNGGDPLTADAIEYAVMDNYRDLHINLSRSWGELAPKFNVETCKGCADRHEVGRELFCLGEACFGEKQAAAAGEGKPHAHSGDKPSAPTKVKPNKHGVITTAGMPFGTFQYLSVADFDTAGCDGCEHRKPASRDGKPASAQPTCFNIPCWDDKTAAHRKQLSGTDRLAATCLDDWVRDRLREKLVGDAALRFQLLAWMAAGLQSQYSIGNASALYGVRPFQSLLTVAAAEETGTLDVMPILDAGLHHLLAARAEAYAYARHIGVTLTAQNWRVDARYLDLKTKPELIKMLIQANETVSSGELAAMKASKRDALLEWFTPAVIEALGVPADVADLFATLEPDSRPDDEDDDDAQDHGDDAGEDLETAVIEPGDLDPRQNLEEAGA